MAIQGKLGHFAFAGCQDAVAETAQIIGHALLGFVRAGRCGGFAEALVKVCPFASGDGGNEGEHRVQRKECALGKRTTVAHEGQRQHDRPGQIDEIGNFFGQPGLGIISSEVFALIEPVGRHVAQAAKAGGNGLHSGQIQRVQQIGAGLIVGDKGLAFAGGKSSCGSIGRSAPR